jgi:hypothetical protein
VQQLGLLRHADAKASREITPCPNQGLLDGSPFFHAEGITVIKRVDLIFLQHLLYFVWIEWAFHGPICENQMQV